MYIDVSRLDVYKLFMLWKYVALKLTKEWKTFYFLILKHICCLFSWKQKSVI